MNIIVGNKKGQPVFQFKTKLTLLQKINFCKSVLAGGSTSMESDLVELNLEMSTKEAQKLVKGYSKYLKTVND